MQTIGERIKIFSANIGSQTALAEKLKMSVQTLSGYSNNRSFPDEAFFKGIAELGCNIDWLLTGRGEMLFKADENAKKIKAIREILG